MIHRLPILSLLLSLLLLRPAFCEEEDPVTSLYPEHPRLLLHQDGFDNLKSRLDTDPQLATYFEKLRVRAEAMLEAPLPTYEKPDGFRLLEVSRAVLRRVTALSLMWHVTGNEKYAKRAKQDLLTVTDFPDWNPIHFLDTAEMAAAVGIGLDWLWPTLSETERATLRQAIQRHALVPYLSTHTAMRYGTGVKGVQWVDKDTNWNAVCNGGVLLAALAAAEKDDLVSMNQLRAVLAATRKQLPINLESYAPDGAYPEGSMYWGYGSFYLAMALNALESGLGDDFGLAENAGLRNTGAYVLHAHDPNGWNLNYADSTMNRKGGNLKTARLYFAKRFELPLLAELHHMQMALPENEGEVTAWDILWYEPGTEEEYEMPRSALFRGQTPLAVWRSAWDDPDALYVGMIGGTNPGPHGHLDLGNFELRAKGQAWIIDLGRDDYSLPGYWDRKAGGERWSYLALGTQGHNVPMIAGKQQNIPARADFSHFSAAGAMIDLSEAYAPAKVTRGLRQLADGTAVLVQDEITGAEGEIVWGLTINPDAEIQIDESIATLTLNEKTLRIQYLSPEGAQFRKRVIAPKIVGEMTAMGGTRLELVIGNPENKTTVAVLFAPGTKDAAALIPDGIQPLGEWEADLKPTKEQEASENRDGNE